MSDLKQGLALESLANLVDHVHDKFAITRSEYPKPFAQPYRLIRRKRAGWQNEFIDPTSISVGELEKALQRRHHDASLKSGNGFLTNAEPFCDLLLRQLRSDTARRQSCAKSFRVQFRGAVFLLR